MRPNYWWIQPNYRQMRPNFGFSEDYYSFHMWNTIQPNISEFHWFFLIFLKINRIDHLEIFCSARIFKHQAKLPAKTQIETSWKFLHGRALRGPGEPLTRAAKSMCSRCENESKKREPKPGWKMDQWEIQSCSRNYENPGKSFDLEQDRRCQNARRKHVAGASTRADREEKFQRQNRDLPCVSGKTCRREQERNLDAGINSGRKILAANFRCGKNHAAETELPWRDLPAPKPTPEEKNEDWHRNENLSGKQKRDRNSGAGNEHHQWQSQPNSAQIWQNHEGKTNSTKGNTNNRFSIEIKTRLHLKYRGHHPPSLI
jgi:hypothetical protein